MNKQDHDVGEVRKELEMNVTMENARSFARSLLAWAKMIGDTGLERARRIFDASDFARLGSLEEMAC